MSTGLWIKFLLLARIGSSCIQAMFPFLEYDARPDIQDHPGCYMDGILYKFGARWSPVLEPQGLMVCIKCECLAIEKKGIVQSKGRIVCKNIKDLCPEPECDHPVLKPGKCCKTCSGKDDFESTFSQSNGATLSNDVYSLDDNNSFEPQEFQAYLVGKHVRGGPVKTRAVAQANIRVVKGEIQFALRYSRLGRPTSVLLQDIHGNVFFEKPLRQDIKGDKKVCGVWRTTPGFYLRYFRQGKLYATVTTSRYPDGIVSGKIMPRSAIKKEIFSAMLSPAKHDGIGGFVKIGYTPSTRLVSYTITLEGVRGLWKKGDFHVAVLRGSTTVYQTDGSLLPTTGELMGSWRMSKRQHRKQLARGRLQVKVTLGDLVNLRGVIQPRLGCDIFQAVLSSSQTVDQGRTFSSGSAVLKIGEEGRLDYSILVSGLKENVTRIRLEGSTSKYGHGPRLVGNLFKSDITNQFFPLNKWVNGTYRKLEAGDVFRLLNSQLFLNIVTAKQRISNIRGRLVAFEYNSHFVKTGIPVSLTPVSDQVHGRAAHTWLSFSSDCVLHFDAVVSSSGKKYESFDVVLGSHDSRERTFPLRQSVGGVSEVASSYRHTTGEVVNIPDDLLIALDRGQAFIQINIKKNGEAAFKGNVTLANACWRYSNDVDMDYAEEDHTDFLSTDQNNVPVCNFEGHFYEEGSTWLPDVNPECTTCSCVSGRILCQDMICPVLPCKTPVQRDGECCPSCPYEDDSETCQLGNDPRKFRVHSIWHPYLPMEGFTKCAVCKCLVGGKVHCEKSSCPVLNCPKSQWVKKDKAQCCYECETAATKEVSNEEPQQDQNINGACTFMEQAKANRDKWHPSLHPFGPLRCILCECQDGTVNCGRIHCPELACSHKAKPPGKCCGECKDKTESRDGEMSSVILSGTGAELKMTKPTGTKSTVKGARHKA